MFLPEFFLNTTSSLSFVPDVVPTGKLLVSLFHVISTGEYTSKLTVYQLPIGITENFSVIRTPAPHVPPAPSLIVRVHVFVESSNDEDPH